ncbi:hypothetical protein PEX1_076800 [Penicillium expansum]|uniref:Uncharacterized protein n=1 Tax=Penicillium expansum TaxID=27334 RepID=A0A0A2K6D7_PENEN|nr:hypothetical protein PEX2_018330 [Penicillium expansum]KGO46806.1 hypothetical protein PEXP_064960 [Penicillium expansum]KGO54495.1 hypothetical protein PEX1_076800 [Penicillium expansum]KGO62426.1 hypothetical protein PEX2_018330 [Penicillium expansum]
MISLPVTAFQMLMSFVIARIMTKATMKITWNEQADAKLLAGILATTPTPIDFRALAEYMGDGVTVSAVRHRVTRLRAKAEANDGSGTSAPASPVANKRQRATPKKSAKATASKSKEAVTESGEGPVPKDEETDDEDVKGKKPKIKQEDTDLSILSSDSFKEEEGPSDL